MLKKYLFLTKPGILFGNFVTTLGGFFLAAQGSVDFLLLLITLLGTTLVVASGCVVNNVIDQDIDQKMERTMNRALVKKTISPSVALAFSAALERSAAGSVERRRRCSSAQRSSLRLSVDRMLLLLLMIPPGWFWSACAAKCIAGWRCCGSRAQ